MQLTPTASQTVSALAIAPGTYGTPVPLVAGGRVLPPLLSEGPDQSTHLLRSAELAVTGAPRAICTTYPTDRGGAQLPGGQVVRVEVAGAVVVGAGAVSAGNDCAVCVPSWVVAGSATVFSAPVPSV